MHSPACSVAARSTSHEVIKDVISTVTSAAATNHHHNHHNNGNNSGTSTPKNSSLAGNVQNNNNNTVSGGSNKSTPRTSPALTSSNNNGNNNNNNTVLLNQSVPGISFVLPTPTNSNNNISSSSVASAAEYITHNNNCESNSPSTNAENNLFPQASSSPQNIIIYGNSSSAQYNQTFEQLPTNLAKFANKKNIFTLDARYPMNQQAIQQHFQNQNQGNNNTNNHNSNSINTANNNSSNNRKFSSFYYQQQQQQQHPQPHPYYTNKNFSSFTNSQLRACDCVLVRNGHFLSEEAWASLYDELMKVEKAQHHQDNTSPNKTNNKNQNDDDVDVEDGKKVTSTKIDAAKNPSSQAMVTQSSVAAAAPKSMQIPHHRPPVVIALCDDAFYDHNEEDTDNADRKNIANSNSNNNSNHFMSQHNNHHYSFLSRYSKDPSLCYQIRISGSGVMANSNSNDNDAKSDDTQAVGTHQQHQHEMEKPNIFAANNNKSSNMMMLSKPVTNSSFSGAMGWMSMMASSSSSSFGGNNNNNNLLIGANQLASPGLPYHAGMSKNNNMNNMNNNNTEGTSSSSFASSSSSSFTFAPNHNNALVLSVPPLPPAPTAASINTLIQTPTSTFTEDGTSTNFLNPFASENEVGGNNSKKTQNAVATIDHEADAVDDTRALLLTSSLLHNFHDLITKTDNGEITSNKEILLVRDSMLKMIEANSSVPSSTVFLPSSGTVTKVTQHFLQQLRLQHDKDNKRRLKDENNTIADGEATNNKIIHHKSNSSFVPISYFSVPERNGDTIKPLAKIYMSSGGDIHNNNGTSSDSKKSSNQNSNNPFVPKSSLANVANSIPMQQTVCNEMPIFVLAGSLLIPLQTQQQQQQDYSEVTLTTTVPHYTKVVGFYSLKCEMENKNDNTNNETQKNHHQLTRERLIDLVLLKNFQKKSHTNNNNNNNNNTNDLAVTAVKAKSSLPAENPEDLAKELDEYDRHFSMMDDLDLMMNEDKDHDAKLHMISEFLNRCYNALPVVEIMQDKFILIPSMSSWKSSLPKPAAPTATATMLNGSTSVGMMSMNRSSNNSGNRSPATFFGTPSNNSNNNTNNNNVNSIMSMFGGGGVKNSAITSSNQTSLLSTPSNSVPATPSVGMNDGSLLFPPPSADDAAAAAAAQNDSPSTPSFYSSVENNDHPNNLNAGATPPGLPFIPGYRTAGMMMMTAMNGTPTQSASSSSLPQQHDSRRSHSHLDHKEDLVSVCFLPLFPAVAVSAGFRNGSEKEILALRMAVRDLFLKRQQQQNEMKTVSNDKQNHHVSFSETVSVVNPIINNNNYFSAWWSSQDPCDVYRALMNLREAVYSFEGSGEIVVLPTSTATANDVHHDPTAISSPTTASSVTTQSTASIASSSSASLSKKQHTTISKQECQAVFFTAVAALLQSLVADLVTVNTNARTATRKHHHHTNQPLPTEQTVVETWLRSFVTSRCKSLPSSVLTASTASSNNTNSSQSTTFSPTQTIRSTRDLYTGNDDDNLSLQPEDTDSKAMDNHKNMSMNQERQQILHDEFFQDVFDAKNQPQWSSSMVQSKPRSVIIVEDNEYHQISKNRNTNNFTQQQQQEEQGSPRTVKRTIPKRSSIINNNNNETTSTPKNVRFMLPREHFERRKQLQLEQQQQQQKNKDNKGNAENNTNVNNSFSLRRALLTPTSSTTMATLLGTVVDRIGGPLVAAVGVTAGFALGATLFQRFANGNSGSSVNSIANFFRKNTHINMPPKTKDTAAAAAAAKRTASNKHSSRDAEPEEEEKPLEEAGVYIFEAHGNSTYDGQVQRKATDGVVRRSGTGVYTDRDNFSYAGEWKDDVPHGNTSVVKFASGARYEGCVVEGRFDGRGTYTWPDGKRQYTGQWRANRVHGEGTYRDANGVVWTGRFYNGVGPGLSQSA